MGGIIIESEFFNGINNLKDFNMIRFLIASELRLKLLLSIYKSSKSIKELELEFNKKSSNISRGLNELKEYNLITRLPDKKFSITSSGFLLVENLDHLMINFENIDKKSEFWENHTINSIPNKFLKELSLFNDSTIIKSSPMEFSKPINVYLKNISQSKDIFMILPIYSKIFMDCIYDTIINHNGYLDLITTKDIFDLIIKSDSEKYFKSLVRNKKINYYLVEDIANIFFTATNTFSSLFLFFDNLVFDNSEMFFIDDENLVKHAIRFYDSYKSYLFE
ncbi:helix-turn-helix transcriptional regulator [Methanobrevibacter millerae]|uniref:Predicted transcriptional regulator, contains HTH domain n=1 Tax=Methanobrevibacter millerae TaxID=230361 RepID=A0A1G5XPK5_9EURY|nr:hypothetical protein [Methanobrevibacter millerae]SDA72388.1 Predicted transcriptional regulator, contains HTH domain [Methanobrevibacter millerae]